MTDPTREAIKHMRDEGRFSVPLSPSERAEALAKSLAIKLAVRELEKLKGQDLSEWMLMGFAEDIIQNFLIRLGCEAVVDAWNEVS